MAFETSREGTLTSIFRIELRSFRVPNSCWKVQRDAKQKQGVKTSIKPFHLEFIYLSAKRIAIVCHANNTIAELKKFTQTF